jgi:hypothetical protein
MIDAGGIIGGAALIVMIMIMAGQLMNRKRKTRSTALHSFSELFNQPLERVAPSLVDTPQSGHDGWEWTDRAVCMHVIAK